MEDMAPIPDKRAYLALRGGFPPEIIDTISEFQKADDQGIPNSILCSEMRDKYDRPAHKKIRRMLPFTTFWGIEAFATEDSGGMFVNLLLDHKHPYFAQIMMRAQVVLEWHLSVRYLPFKSRVCACREDRVYLKSRGDASGTWYLFNCIHAVLKKLNTPTS
jgi:hypothetical protein